LGRLLIESFPATTTVAPDGTTHTYSHPYNPSTDPPPQASETVVNQKLPSNSGVVSGTNTNTNNQAPSQSTSNPREQTRPNPTITQQAPTPSNSYRDAPPRKPTPQQVSQPQSQYAPPAGPPPGQPQNTNTSPSTYAEAELDASMPLSASTTGGRTIPPRSEYPNQRGTSPNPGLAPPNTNADEGGFPSPPARSPKRNSFDGGIRPLNTTKTNANEGLDPAVSPTSPVRSHTPNFSHTGVESYSPTRPNELGNTTTISADPPQPPPKHQSKRESLFGAIKGIHGAGEVVRGSVNAKLAHVSHDTAEEERMRAIRDKGIGEWRGSGLGERAGVLREGFREKAGERQRHRRLSAGTGVHGSEGPNGLGVVEERER